MKIAVTGCNGSVGRRVVVHCLNEGHSIVGIDCSDPVLDDMAVRRAMEHEAFGFIKADLRAYDETLEVLEGCDGVVHLAAYPTPGDCVVQTHNSNVVISWNVLRAAAELKITRIVQASSCNVIPGVYSKHGPYPKYFPIDEDHPCEPDEPYGLSKLIAELQAATIVRRYSEIRIASLRLHWAVPRSFATRREPEKRRNDLWGYVHPDCAATAFLLALTVEEGKFNGHEVFFIAAPDIADDRSSSELHERFFGHVKLKEGERLASNTSFVSSKKAERVLGWVHQVPEDAEM